jgi:hypothetical protein
MEEGKDREVNRVVSFKSSIMQLCFILGLATAGNGKQWYTPFHNGVPQYRHASG